MLRELRKAQQFFKTDGIRGLRDAFRRRIDSNRRDRTYQNWLAKYDVLTDEEEAAVTDVIKGFCSQPRISVLMPVYNVDARWLRKAIESVLRQSYSNWEFCIADDNSPSFHVREILDEYAAHDSRIKVMYRPENGHISAASNSALGLATGDYVCLLDHDDELAPNALYFVAKEINDRPEVDMIYSDEDKIDTRGRRTAPSFKPDWSPELFYSLNLVTHLSVYRTSILREIGGFRIGFEGSQDYDLGLRFSERIDHANIRHIPRVLYHWRSIPGSVALDSSEKNYAHQRARISIAEHFERTGIRGQVVRGFRELHRVRYELPDPVPLTSLIFVGKPVGEAANRIREDTTYARMEIVNADSRRSADLNEAARRATGSVLCFLDPSSRVLSKDWLTELVGVALQKGTGAVGPRIIFPNGRIKNAGLLMGINGGIGRAHYKAPAHSIGNFFRLKVVQNVSSLSIDCMAIRKTVFDAAGGFDTDTFPNEYGEVDICLRFFDMGYRNVWTPWAGLMQRSEHVYGRGAELDALKARWSKYFENDPYYNPNLTAEAEDMSLAFPPRSSKI